MMVTMAAREEYHEGKLGSNIAIAAFTTSHAMIKFLDMMERLGERLLYYTIDSVILSKNRGNGNQPWEKLWENNW